MADPLSIASGIAGLIALAGKLSSILSEFYKNTKDAPSFANNLTSEVVSLRVILKAIQKLVDDGSGGFDESRLSMISVNDLRLALMGCICVFSTLEKELLDTDVSLLDGKLKRTTPEVKSRAISMPALNSWNDMIFATKTSLFKGILEDLQRHKLTLSLMLGVIQCETSSEALRKAEALKESVERVVRSQSIVSKELQILMAREGPPSDNISQFDASSSVLSNVQSILSIPLRSFETVLRRTRVYRHGYIWNTSSLSLGSSVMKRTRWTTMSDLSLSDISNMAVIDLPIWPQDIWNPEYYVEQPPPSESIMSANEEEEVGPSNASIAPTISISKGQKHLLYAIVDTDISEVTQIVESGISLDLVDRKGLGPLHWAVQTGCIEIATLLIDKGANLDTSMPDLYYSPLHSAVNVDDADMAKLLIDRGCNIESRNHLDMTPLAFAAVTDSENCARLLLDAGANIKTREKKEGKTPLHLAAQHNAPKVATLLLERGANIKARDRNMRSPKMWAMVTRSKNVQEILDAYGGSRKGKQIAA